MAATSVVATEAAPLVIKPAASAPQVDETTIDGNVVHVQSRRDAWQRRNWDRRHHSPREGMYRGYRGHREYRPGYRRHGNFWYPAAAFLAGALITGAIANSNQAPPARARSGNAHVQWCYNRYKSYRASDNTFQPYNGPRQQCYSPY
jgi:hypothetical protein